MMRIRSSSAGRRGRSAGPSALIAILAPVVALILASCPSPIPADLAGQINDTIGPVVTITEPADRSQYSTVIRASGTIVDSDGGASVPTTGRISDCRYSVVGTQVTGVFAVDDNGVFSFLFATREPDGGRTRILGDPRARRGDGQLG